MPSTFYVSLLNPAAQALGYAGSFDGAVTGAETGISTLAIDIPLANIKSHFKFKCAGDPSDDGELNNIDVTGVIGVATTTAAAWTFPASSAASAIVLQNEFVSALAKKVFGSPGAVDLFGNRSQVEAAWHNAAAAALVSLKAKTYSSGVDASKQLIDAMFYSGVGGAAKGVRFSMAYDATTDAVLVTSGAGDGNGKTVNGGSGVGGAKVDISSTGLVVSTTGVGYVAGDTITITGDNSALVFKINSVQAAMLNGTLDAAAGTEVPLCVGDKIKVVFEIDSNGAQKDVSGDAAPVAQRFNVEYTLVV